MRGTLLQQATIVLAATLLVTDAAHADAPPASVVVDFVAFSNVDEYDTKTYRSIWEEYGERIVDSLERRTCLPFSESSVSAVVAEDVSHSGGPEHPMQLRASYIRKIKQSTLAHELGHRHLWQLVERLDGIDGHMTLYLVLDRVWADVWGEEFAAERIKGESGWHASYDYAAAWNWARSLKAEERARLWNQLLLMNGFPGSCKGLTERAK